MFGGCLAGAWQAFGGRSADARWVFGRHRISGQGSATGARSQEPGVKSQEPIGLGAHPFLLYANFRPLVALDISPGQSGLAFVCFITGPAQAVICLFQGSTTGINYRDQLQGSTAGISQRDQPEGSAPNPRNRPASRHFPIAPKPTPTLASANTYHKYFRAKTTFPVSPNEKRREKTSRQGRGREILWDGVNACMRCLLQASLCVYSHVCLQKRAQAQGHTAALRLNPVRRVLVVPLPPLSPKTPYTPH